MIEFSVSQLCCSVDTRLIVIVIIKKLIFAFISIDSDPYF